MMTSFHWRAGVVVLACFFLSSCASTRVSNIEDVESLSFADDEKGLWERVEDMQKVVLKSDLVYVDEELSVYVNEILDKLIGDIVKEKGLEVTVYVIKDPNFNASAFPNGVIYVHSGLVANLESEAQLATVLGHESIHFLHRHLLKQHRTSVNMSALANFVQLAAAGASGGLAYSGYNSSGVSLIGQYLALGIQGAFFGYGRGLEREADRDGFDLIVEAGYDPRETKKAFEIMYEATKKEKFDIPYFYQTHPKTKARIKSFEKLIKKHAEETNKEPEGVVEEKAYIQKTRNVLIDNARMDIMRNKKDIAKRQIERIKKHFPDDPSGIYLEAKWLVLEEKKEEAIQKLVDCVEKAPDLPEARVDLGLLYYKSGEKDKAKEQFKKYLALRPNAQDAEYVRGYLNEE